MVFMCYYFKNLVKGLVQYRVIGRIVLCGAHCRVKLHTDNKICWCTYCKSPQGICPRPFAPLVSATVLWRRSSLRNQLWMFCSVNRLRWAKLILNYIVFFSIIIFNINLKFPYQIIFLADTFVKALKQKLKN